MMRHRSHPDSSDAPLPVGSRRAESPAELVKRGLLIAAAIVAVLGAFIGTIVGIEAIRVAKARAADRDWHPPAAAARADAMIEPSKSNAIAAVAHPSPQRIALWAPAATLTGGGISMGGKRDRVIVGWISEAARATWPLDAAPAAYYVDVTYSTENADGGAFKIEAGPIVLEAVAQRTAGKNTFITVRMGTLTISKEVATLTIRAASPLPKRSLMSLQRVDLRPVGDPESEAAPVVAVGDAVQNIDGLSNTRDRKGWRGGNRDRRSLLDELAKAVGNGPAEPAPVKGVVLIDADSGRPIQVLLDNATINLAALPTRRLNIRAETGDRVGSVGFGLDDRDTLVVERAPFAMFSNSRGGDSPILDLREGAHRITATSFAGAKASGAAADPLRVRFNVIDNPGIGEPAVAALNLLDTDRGVVVRALSDGLKLDATDLPRHWTIAAAVTGDVQSVRFEWNAPKHKGNHIEDNMPYALAGDVDGKYLPVDLGAGPFRVSASPYTEKSAKGKKGKSLTVSFSTTR